MTDAAVPEISQSALETVLQRHRAWLESAGAEGARADLGGCSLAGISLWRADLRGASLEDIDLRGANLDHARLGGASLRHARLAGASLWEADLTGCDLAGADLRHANLDHAQLRAADLRGADLRDASLWGAQLDEADLRDAEGVPGRGAEPAPHPSGVHVGEVFVEARRPQQRWRVTHSNGRDCRIEQVDNPNRVRFPTAAALHDPSRYIRAR